MTSFKNADAGVIVDQLIKTIQKERDYLSEIDGKIGDGDHGINMNKGFTMCEKKLEGTTYNLCRRNSGYQPCTGRRQITARYIDSSKRSICRSKRSRKRLCRMFGCYECRSRKRMAVYKRSCSQDRTSKPPWRTLSRCS